MRGIFEGVEKHIQDEGYPSASASDFGHQGPGVAHYYTSNPYTITVPHVERHQPTYRDTTVPEYYPVSPRSIQVANNPGLTEPPLVQSIITGFGSIALPTKPPSPADFKEPTLPPPNTTQTSRKRRAVPPDTFDTFPRSASLTELRPDLVDGGCVTPRKAAKRFLFSSPAPIIGG